MGTHPSPGVVWKSYDFQRCFDGFYVSERRDINLPIAYVGACGLDGMDERDAQKLADLIAEDPEVAGVRSCIDLRRFGRADSREPMPGFVFGIWLGPVDDDAKLFQLAPYCPVRRAMLNRQYAERHAPAATPREHEVLRCLEWRLERLTGRPGLDADLSRYLGRIEDRYNRGEAPRLTDLQSLRAAWELLPLPIRRELMNGWPEPDRVETRSELLEAGRHEPVYRHLVLEGGGGYRGDGGTYARQSFDLASTAAPVQVKIREGCTFADAAACLSSMLSFLETRWEELLALPIDEPLAAIKKAASDRSNVLALGGRENGGAEAPTAA